jgi:hypothetical protein
MPRSAMLDMSVVLGRSRPVMGEVSGSPAEAREENLCRRQKCAWPASIHAAQAADRPRLAEAWGSLRRDLALQDAFGEPAS